MIRFRLLLLCLFLATPAAGRTLYWKSVDVKAHLDGEGKLHVRERQTIVFDGDWNGGERGFRLEPHHELHLAGMKRIEPDGTVVVMRRGDLSQVDMYALNGDMLRWRSRMPDDPPFANTELTYEISYVMSGVLVPVKRLDGERYFLNHDFAFADRPAEIRKFSLDLTLERFWTIDGPPFQFTPVQLQPGYSFVVQRDLRYSGTGRPAAAAPATRPWRLATAALLLAGLICVFAHRYLTEKKKGRFEKITVDIDEAWLTENVFSQLPEVVGYMYDAKSGPPEVAAALARMVQSGKLESRVEKRVFRSPVLHLKRTAKEQELDMIEEQIVRMMFFGDAMETSTEKIRKFYRKSGFNPAARIERTLDDLADRCKGWSEQYRKPSKVADKVLVVGCVLLASGLVLGWFAISFAIAFAVLGGAGTAIGGAIARRSVRRLNAAPFWWAAAAFPLLPAVAFFISQALRETIAIHLYSFFTVALYLVASYAWVLAKGAAPDSPARLAVRKRMEAARKWFMRELKTSTPQLRDEWTPYLLALGLGRDVDRWFAAFGGTRATVDAGPRMPGLTRTSSSIGSTSSSTSIGNSIRGSWSGGGSSFGGAGATGSWSFAASSLGSGISAPLKLNVSASGSGSGGSYGGSSSSSSSSSSSGGGSGGGW